jgi:hypothetical protein
MTGVLVADRGAHHCFPIASISLGVRHREGTGVGAGFARQAHAEPRTERVFERSKRTQQKAPLTSAALRARLGDAL